MASFRILSILEKQKALFVRNQSSGALAEWGRFYLEQGRVYDALDFFERSGARAPVEELRQQALRTGNLFLYRRTTQILKEEAGPADLAEVAERCAREGKEAYSRAARGEPPVPPKEPSKPSPPAPG